MPIPSHLGQVDIYITSLSGVTLAIVHYGRLMLIPIPIGDNVPNRLFLSDRSAYHSVTRRPSQIGQKILPDPLHLK